MTIIYSSNNSTNVISYRRSVVLESQESQKSETLKEVEMWLEGLPANFNVTDVYIHFKTKFGVK